MSTIEPTNPFHIARAYGTAVPGPARVSTSGARPVAIRAMDESIAARLERTPPSASRVVAGVVPGKIDFTGSSPAPAAAALPFYRHPADANAAATAVQAGRRLDVTG